MRLLFYSHEALILMDFFGQLNKKYICQHIPSNIYVDNIILERMNLNACPHKTHCLQNTLKFNANKKTSFDSTLVPHIPCKSELYPCYCRVGYMVRWGLPCQIYK